MVVSDMSTTQIWGQTALKAQFYIEGLTACNKENKNNCKTLKQLIFLKLPNIMCVDIQMYVNCEK